MSCSGSRQFAWCIIFIDCVLFHVQSSGVQLDRSSDDLFIYLIILKQYLYRLSNSAKAGLNGGLCSK